MGSTFEVDEDNHWFAANWLFNFLLECISESDLPHAVTLMAEQHREYGFGYLRISELPPDDQAALRTYMRDRLWMVADERLPADMKARDEVLKRIGRLVEMVS